MKRKNFLKNGLLGATGIVAIPTLISSCSKDENNGGTDNNGSCAVSPTETAGPFPIKTPAELVKANIVGDRTGVPMMLTIKIENVNDNCKALSGVLVDVWHCDARGNYSEYSGQQDGNFTDKNFLRGRQTTDANGNASFVTIFPGWYPGRAPHIHLEVKSADGKKSLLISQISWDEDISRTVFATDGYTGNHDTSNSRDNIVDDANLADSLTGNVTDGYTLIKTIRVKA